MVITKPPSNSTRLWRQESAGARQNIAVALLVACTPDRAAAMRSAWSRSSPGEKAITRPSAATRIAS